MTDKEPSAWPSLLILVLFIAAALNQCGRAEIRYTPKDACGDSGSRPVTIGGTMTIACH